MMLQLQRQHKPAVGEHVIRDSVRRLAHAQIGLQLLLGK
jgi:hypothetical protein